jgi:6,7-dimethyl-8-ribityllumazine synthase
VVIRWETPHFDYVCNETARGVMNLNTMYETPVIFWLLTCNNDEQVKARINAWFAVSGLNLLAELEKIKE